MKTDYGSAGIWIGLLAGLTTAGVLLFIRFERLSKRLVTTQSSISWSIRVRIFWISSRSGRKCSFSVMTPFKIKSSNSFSNGVDESNSKLLLGCGEGDNPISFVTPASSNPVRMLPSLRNTSKTRSRCSFRVYSCLCTLSIKDSQEVSRNRRDSLVITLSPPVFINSFNTELLGL